MGSRGNKLKKEAVSDRTDENCSELCVRQSTVVTEVEKDTLATGHRETRVERTQVVLTIDASLSSLSLTNTMPPSSPVSDYLYRKMAQMNYICVLLLCI